MTNIPDWLAQEVAEYDMDLAVPPATVLDIGANIGAFALRAHERWPEAEIHAFEPVKENFEQLCRNTFTHFKTVPTNLAVMETDDERFIFRGVSHSSGSFYDLGGQTALTERVGCISARSLDSADFVKIDAEGAELDALTGLDLSRTRALAVEYHRYEDVDKIRAIAEGAGLAMVVNKRHFSMAGHGILKFARTGALKPIPNSVFVGVPVYGSMVPEFVKCLMNLTMRPPCSIAVEFKTGDSLVSRARNSLTSDFLKTECTHLLFIDSDLVFSAEQIARLLAHGKEVIGGFYPKKMEGLVQWVCNGMDGKPTPGPDGLQELRYIGTGFLLVRRDVFERVIAEYGEEIAYHPEHSPKSVEYDLWPVGTYHYPDGGCRYLSEDWYFCQRWLDLGGQVWGDPRVILKHVGQAIYPLKTQLPELTAVKVAPGPASDMVEPFPHMEREVKPLTPQPA